MTERTPQQELKRGVWALRLEVAPSIADDISRLATAALSAERELCAKIAEDVATANLSHYGEATVGSSVAQGIANRIRNTAAV